MDKQSSDDFHRMLLTNTRLWERWMVIQLLVRPAVMSLNTTIPVQTMESGIRDPMNESICKQR
jgi:hypothetical protein